MKTTLRNLSTLIETLIFESKPLFVAYSFISLVMRKPTRGLNIETKNKQFDMDFPRQGKKKKMKGKKETV